MKQKLLIVVICFFALLSCKKHITADSDYPDLPAYSEKGLDVSGAHINDSTWLGNNEPSGFSPSIKPVYLTSYPNGDSIELRLFGSYKSWSIAFEKPSQISIVIKGIKIKNDNDLLKLNNQKYVLDGINNYCKFYKWYDDSLLTKGTGQIQFGKIEKNNFITYGDGSPNNPFLYPYICAAKFELKVVDNITYNLTHGRFDITLLKTSTFSVKE